MTNIIILL